MMKPVPWDILEQALEDDDGTGFCLNCGEPASYCEPDAEEYPCEACKQNMVYGAATILVMGVIS